MKCHALLLSAALVLGLAAGLDARAATFEGPHVRPLDATGAKLLQNAKQSSATVRNLVNKLDASDLIVYVRVVPATGALESTISYVSTTRMARIVMVSIAEDSASDRGMELLGHELEHAVEIADRHAITTDADFQNMLSLIGYRDSSRARGYETPAAAKAEGRVRREVRATGQGL